LERINKIKEIIPNCSISCDIIAGFCTETEEDHQATLSLMDECKFIFSYMYKYSERPGTLAQKKMQLLVVCSMAILQIYDLLKAPLSTQATLRHLPRP
jgi:tRNA A37 methylthiotransferase MiaB